MLLKHTNDFDMIDINLKYELSKVSDGSELDGQAPIHALARFESKLQYTERELLTRMLTYTGSSGPLDINQRNDQNETMLYILCEETWGNGANAFVEIVLAHCGDIDIDAVGNDGNTPLQKLCMQTTTQLHRHEYQNSTGFEPNHFTVIVNGHMVKKKNSKVDKDEIQEIYGILPSVQLMVAFGASLTLPSASTGKNAIEMVEALATAHTGVESDGRHLKNTTSIVLKQWFDATSEWSPIEVAAGCRLYKEISTAVIRGVMNLDSFELHELKRALRLAKTPANELGWPADWSVHDTPSVEEKMIFFMDSAVKSWRKGWSPVGHWLYHSGVQTAVKTVLMVAARLHLKVNDWQVPADIDGALSGIKTAANERARFGTGNSTADSDRSDSDGHGVTYGHVGGTLPLLPPEMWCHIMSFFSRTDWELPPIGEEWYSPPATDHDDHYRYCFQPMDPNNFYLRKD